MVFKYLYLPRDYKSYDLNKCIIQGQKEVSLLDEQFCIIPSTLFYRCVAKKKCGHFYSIYNTL